MNQKLSRAVNKKLTSLNEVNNYQFDAKKLKPKDFEAISQNSERVRASDIAYTSYKKFVVKSNSHYWGVVVNGDYDDYIVDTMHLSLGRSGLNISWGGAGREFDNIEAAEKYADKL